VVLPHIRRSLTDSRLSFFAFLAMKDSRMKVTLPLLLGVGQPCYAILLILGKVAPDSTARAGSLGGELASVVLTRWRARPDFHWLTEDRQSPDSCASSPNAQNGTPCQISTDVMLDPKSRAISRLGERGVSG